MIDPAPPHGPPRRASRLAAVLWIAAITCALVLLVGGAVTAAALGERDAAQPVTEARLTTTTYLPAGGRDRQSYTFWTDAAAAVARLDSSNGRRVYYARGNDGRWSADGRSAASGRWLTARLAAGQAPSLLSAHGLAAYFARLRSQARDAACADLRHHLACAFAVNDVTWPFVYQGPTTVWLDGVTGLPVQFRDVVAGKGRPLVVITSVDAVRETSTTALPPAFFTPPSRHVAMWDRVMGRVGAWLRRKLDL